MIDEMFNYFETIDIFLCVDIVFLILRDDGFGECV
jgi:hypothetical protein